MAVVGLHRLGRLAVPPSKQQGVFRAIEAISAALCSRTVCVRVWLCVLCVCVCFNMSVVWLVVVVWSVQCPSSGTCLSPHGDSRF